MEQISVDNRRSRVLIGCVLDRASRASPSFFPYQTSLPFSLEAEGPLWRQCRRQPWHSSKDNNINFWFVNSALNWSTSKLLVKQMRTSPNFWSWLHLMCLQAAFDVCYNAGLLPKFLTLNKGEDDIKIISLCHWLLKRSWKRENKHV